MPKKQNLKAAKKTVHPSVPLSWMIFTESIDWEIPLSPSTYGLPGPPTPGSTWAGTDLYSPVLCPSRSHWLCSAESWAPRFCSLPSRRRWQSWRKGSHRCWGSSHWWGCQGFHRIRLSGSKDSGPQRSKLGPKLKTRETNECELLAGMGEHLCGINPASVLLDPSDLFVISHKSKSCIFTSFLIKHGFWNIENPKLCYTKLEHTFQQCRIIMNFKKYYMVLELKNNFLHSILHLFEIWKNKAICYNCSRVTLGSRKYLRNAVNCAY